MLNRKLHWHILVALVAALAAGTLDPYLNQRFGFSLVPTYAFIGTLFLNALQMIVVPLIVASIVSGVSRLGAADLGRLGWKTVTYYLATGLLAVITGLVVVNIIRPGAGAELVVSAGEVARITEEVAGRGGSDMVEIFLRMVPKNIVAAAAEGQMLGLIFFALLFGYFMTRLPSPSGDTLKRFWQAVFEVMMGMTGLVMLFAPLGVFGLVAKVVAETGFDQFRQLGLFMLTVLGALAIHVLITYPLLLRFVAGVNPRRHYAAMAPALMTAFSTASSSATLPLTLQCVENRAGVSNRTSSFVLPLGATINMDGTALYECVVAMFIAQLYGIDLSFTQQFIVVATALITSVGVAGIPSASLVAIVVILGIIGLPLEGIGTVLVVDRLLDMVRTAVNVFGDSCGAVLIARLEGEETRLVDPGPGATGAPSE